MAHTVPQFGDHDRLHATVRRRHGPRLTGNGLPAKQVDAKAEARGATADHGDHATPERLRAELAGLSHEPRRQRRPHDQCASAAAPSPAPAPLARTRDAARRRTAVNDRGRNRVCSTTTLMCRVSDGAPCADARARSRNPLERREEADGSRAAPDCPARTGCCRPRRSPRDARRACRRIRDCRAPTPSCPASLQATAREAADRVTTVSPGCTTRRHVPNRSSSISSGVQ